MKIKKCWFRVRFMLFLAKIHLANGMTPKILKKSVEQVNIALGFNVDDVILEMGIIILSSKNMLVFFCKILCAKPEKHDIDIYIYIDEKDIKVSIWVLVDIYWSQWYQ